VLQPLSRAITDYQDGNLSLEQLRRQIEDEIKTPDGVRAIRSILESANQSLPRSVRDLLTGFSTSPAAATNLRVSPIGVGSVLRGRYRLVREIGRGGMGVVYLADGLVDLQQFAVKVLNSEFLQHPEAVRVFREEARKSLAMRHPNIVGVYPLECEGEQYYLPMEYLEGKTIRELLDQDFARGVPLDQAWPIVKGVGAALAFAHDHGVIHSDLKPSNIFVTTEGRPRVLDFGIARALRDRRHFDTDSLGGITAAYASCEMLARRPPDFRDDVYAFACVVYELLTGSHPFAGRTAAEARIGRMVVAPVRALTQAQNTVLRRGLAFNCDDRIATIEEFLTVCGGDVASVGNPRTVPPLEVTWPDDTALRFCAVCARELPNVARFCPGCGASTDAEATTSANDDLQIRGEYRPAATDKDERSALRKRFIAFWATGIAAAVAIGLLAVYTVRSSRSPPAGFTLSAPVPGASGFHAEAPGPGDASRHEPTAAAARPSHPAQEESGAPSTGAARSRAPVVSNLAAASTGPGPDAGSPAPGVTGPAASRPAPDQAGGTAHDEDIEHPPFGKHVSAFKLAQDSPTVDQACPYPAAAEESGDTGTVVLLVYIAADGSPPRTEVESSSDSKLLDDAAVDCVKQNLHFVPRRIAGAAIGSWARLRFKWSIGE
jgi:TonB family protein